jgi:hypothetical protein
LVNDKIRREGMQMNKDLAWNLFKQTGDINVYLEFTKEKNFEENNRLKVELDEAFKNNWNCNS